MLIDLDQASVSQAVYKSRVCIIGAGIAGLILASRLAKQGVDVHLLEAGGKEDEPRSQQIYDVLYAAREHKGATLGRFRVLGGSSTRWGGQLLSYTDDIFQPPVGLPSLPWPISAENVKQYYSEIETILGADSLPFTEEFFSAVGQPIPWSDAGVTQRFSKWLPFRRRNLAQTIGRECLESQRVTVFTHTNVTELLLDENGARVNSVRARNYQDRNFLFMAAQIVLAAGTIETSRLLLASQSTAPQGVGNAHDQVGRYFHDHISVPVAEITGAARRKLIVGYAPFLINGVLHSAKLEANPGLRCQQNLLAVMAHFSIEEPPDSGATMVRSLLLSLQQGRIRDAVCDHLARLPAALFETVPLAYSALVEKRRSVSTRGKYILRMDTEQFQTPFNRIRLADERDSIGLPRTILDWRINSTEHETVRKYAEYLRSRFDRIFPGEFIWQTEVFEPDSERWLDLATDAYHPMGGARMGTNPEASVVDPQLRVHGISNLNIASCAVFPAGGSSNPTFTMIALTLRLADRLAREL